MCLAVHLVRELTSTFPHLEQYFMHIPVHLVRSVSSLGDVVFEEEKHRDEWWYFPQELWRCQDISQPIVPLCLEILQAPFDSSIDRTHPQRQSTRHLDPLDSDAHYRWCHHSGVKAIRHGTITATQCLFLQPLSKGLWNHFSCAKFPLCLPRTLHPDHLWRTRRCIK